MAGQPIVPGVLEFVVTDLTIAEPGGVPPAFIIPTANPFDISLIFDGSGFVWDTYDGTTGLPPITSESEFSLEGLGTAGDFDFGPVVLDLAPGGGPYTATFTVPGATLVPGLYLVKGLVTFPDVPGMSGFFPGAGDAQTTIQIT